MWYAYQSNSCTLLSGSLLNNSFRKYLNIIRCLAASFNTINITIEQCITNEYIYLLFVICALRSISISPSSRNYSNIFVLLVTKYVILYFKIKKMDSFIIFYLNNNVFAELMLLQHERLIKFIKTLK